MFIRVMDIHFSFNVPSYVPTCSSPHAVHDWVYGFASILLGQADFFYHNWVKADSSSSMQRTKGPTQVIGYNAIPLTTHHTISATFSFLWHKIQIRNLWYQNVFIEY